MQKGKLDLTTFEKLKKGAQSGRPDDRIAGKPEESHLVLRIKGEETPRHAPRATTRHVGRGDRQDRTVGERGGQARSRDRPQEADRVVCGQPRSDALAARLAKLPAQERDKKVEAVGLERWKQANPKLKPEIVRGEHFIMFSNLPSDRAQARSRSWTTQYGHLKRLLGSPTTDWVEKVSLYRLLQSERFHRVRPDGGDERSRSRHAVVGEAVGPQPYLAVVDPRGARRRSRRPASGRARSKRGDEKDVDSAGADRSLAGMLTEALGTAAVASAGKPPRWLALGSVLTWRPRSSRGASITSNCVKPPSPISSQGWETRANDALGGTDQITADGDPRRLVSRWWKR